MILMLSVTDLRYISSHQSKAQSSNTKSDSSHPEIQLITSFSQTDGLVLTFFEKRNLLQGCQLDVEDYSEELLRQQSYAIKNQIGHPKKDPLLLAGSLWHNIAGVVTL